MPLYLDTTGLPSLGIAVCSRCGVKYPMVALKPDPNYPGLRCCPDGCLDDLDPYRLAPRETEDITLAYPRPDFHLPPGPSNVWANQMEAAVGNGIGAVVGATGGNPIAAAPPVAVLQQPAAWAAQAAHALGDVVTPAYAVGMAAAGQQIYAFLCIIPGRSGATAPPWNATVGAETFDGGVVWICQGLYLP